MAIDGLGERGVVSGKILVRAYGPEEGGRQEFYKKYDAGFCGFGKGDGEISWFEVWNAAGYNPLFSFFRSETTSNEVHAKLHSEAERAGLTILNKYYPLQWVDLNEECLVIKSEGTAIVIFEDQGRIVELTFLRSQTAEEYNLLSFAYARNYQEYCQGKYQEPQRSTLTEEEKQRISSRTSGKTRNAILVEYGDGSRGIRLK